MEKQSYSDNGWGPLEEDISLREVKQIINTLSNGKAAGEDGIYNEILKYGGDKVSAIVWLLCKRCHDL